MSAIFPFPIPTITPEDLAAFDEGHFSSTHHAHLTAQFLPPPAPVTYIDNAAEPDDDGLGYYPDGAKRTLTDAQISMFRFSEIQELLRRKRHNQNRRKKHRERIAAKKASDTETTLAEARAMAAAEEKVAHPEIHLGATKEEARKGRLEAAIWASEMVWDEQEGGNQGKDVVAPKVMVRVDRASGKEFLWPAIER